MVIDNTRNMIIRPTTYMFHHRVVVDASGSKRKHVCVYRALISITWVIIYVVEGAIVVVISIAAAVIVNSLLS